ncbi:TY-Chap domain-containing protein [Nocardia thailandica]
MTAWDTFAAGLSAELLELPDTATLIIVEPRPAGRRRYVQFYKDADVLAAQLVSDKYLDEAARADETGTQAIVRAGWQPPDADSSFLWWADFDAPVALAEYDRAAALSVAGLRDGYGIADPHGLVYDAWIAGSADRRLDLPRLGLPHQRTT